MNLDVVPSKTPLAWELLQRRDALPRPQRLFLIMVDGRKSLRDLAEAARQLGIDSAALSALSNRGLIQWSPMATSRDKSRDDPSPIAPNPSAPASQSLAAAKMYAMDLLALMLPGRDSELREASRIVTDEEALLAWILRCVDEISLRSGADRAALFRDRVAARLPADFLTRTAVAQP